jgi:hypothetical protein
MTTKGTPGRVVRVDAEIWDAYGRACDDKGISRANDLRMHMLREIKAHEAAQRKIAAQERAAGDKPAASA